MKVGIRCVVDCSSTVFNTLHVYVSTERIDRPCIECIEPIGRINLSSESKVVPVDDDDELSFNLWQVSFADDHALKGVACGIVTSSRDALIDRIH